MLLVDKGWWLHEELSYKKQETQHKKLCTLLMELLYVAFAMPLLACVLVAWITSIKILMKRRHANVDGLTKMDGLENKCMVRTVCSTQYAHNLVVRFMWLNYKSLLGPSIYNHDIIMTELRCQWSNNHKYRRIWQVIKHKKTHQGRSNKHNYWNMLYLCITQVIWCVSIWCVSILTQ